jgi:hypothetical protein
LDEVTGSSAGVLVARCPFIQSWMISM